MATHGRVPIRMQIRIAQLENKMSGKRITITIKEDDDRYDIDDVVATVMEAVSEATQQPFVSFDVIVTDYPR